MIIKSRLTLNWFYYCFKILYRGLLLRPLGRMAPSLLYHSLDDQGMIHPVMSCEQDTVGSHFLNEQGWRQQSSDFQAFVRAALRGSLLFLLQGQCSGWWSPRITLGAPGTPQSWVLVHPCLQLQVLMQLTHSTDGAWALSTKALPERARACERHSGCCHVIAPFPKQSL